MDTDIQTPFDWDNLPADRYDIAAKHAAQEFPNDMLHLILGTDDFEIIEPLDIELPAVEVRRMDSLTKIRLEGKPTLIHREYQLQDSYPVSIARRIAGYRGQCYQQTELPILSYVIYFRPPAGRRDPGGFFQNVDIPGQRFISEYEVIRLYELDGEPLLAARLPGLMPFLPLMQPPAGVDNVTWLQQCVATTRQLPLDTATIDNLLMSLGIFGNLAYDQETVCAIISEEDMRQSSIFQRLMEQPLEEARQKALQEGIQEGIQKGRALGVRETAIDTLLEVLDARFHEQDVALYTPIFEAITDAQLLRQLHHTALRAPTFDDVMQTLKDYQNNGT